MGPTLLKEIFSKKIKPVESQRPYVQIQQQQTHQVHAECGVKLTTEVAARHITHEKQQGAILLTQERRQKVSKNAKKSAFLPLE